MGFNCTDLISLQEMYDYNPNFGLLTDYTPDNGTLAAQAVAANGTACRWLNQSSGGTIDISVAQLDTASTEARKNALAQSSTPVDAWGPDGYFDQGDLGSAAQAFPGPYWVTATSIAFFGAADAAPIMNAVTSAIG